MSTLSLSYIKEKWLHAGFQKYLKNTGWMFFGRFFTLGISFFVGIYIARYLGPANYGLLSYVMSFVGLFGFLTSFGIDGILGREIIKDHSKKDELIGTGFYIKIAGSILAIASIFIVSIFTTKDIFTLGLIWIFSLSFIPQAFNIVEIYFQSQVLSKKVVVAQIVSNIVSAILKIVVLCFDKGIFWLTLVYLVEASVYALLLLVSFRKFGNHIRKWRFNLSVAKGLLRDSWPLIFSMVAIDIYMKIDQVMIKNMLGNEQAGVYAVVVRLAEAWYFVPVIICMSLSPTIIGAFNTDKAIFINRMRRLYFSIFWLSFTFASFITIFAYPIVNILFGNAYLEAIAPLQIYAWAGIGASLGVVVGQYIIISNLTKISLYKALLGALINVILNIILIPKIGIEGAAIATLIAYITSTFGILLFKNSRQQGFLILKSIFNYR